MKQEEKNSESAILQAAEKEFMQKGFAATKTTDIAAEAGVTHAMLHYYFRTKENLFNQVFQQKIGLLKESILILLKQSDQPLPIRVQEAMEAHFDFLMANPDFPRFVLNELLATPERQKMLKAFLSKNAPELIDGLQAQLDEGARQGAIAPLKATTLLYEMLSLNISLFVVRPILQMSLLPTQKSEMEFMQERKKANVELILKRLTPQ